VICPFGRLLCIIDDWQVFIVLQALIEHKNLHTVKHFLKWNAHLHLWVFFIVPTTLGAWLVRQATHPKM
jgi:hypothetical protein